MAKNRPGNSQLDLGAGTRMETPRKLEEIERARSSGMPNPYSPAGMPGQNEADYVMPRPIFPFVAFRHSGSDEEAVAIILRYGDRSLDLGVFAPNNRTMMQKDGVRHVTDPAMARLAEHVPGVWDECEAVKDFMDSLRVGIPPEILKKLEEWDERLVSLESQVKDLNEITFDTETAPSETVQE